MKIFVGLFLIITFLFSAEVDKTFYENIKDENFFLNIENSIKENEKKREFSVNSIELSKINLNRLKEINSKKIELETLDKKLLNPQNIDIESIYKIFILLVETQNKIEKQKKFLDETQNRLAYIKKSIESTTESTKENLLSLQLQFAYNKIQKTNLDAIIKQLEENQKAAYEQLLLHIEKATKNVQNDINNNILELQKNIDKKSETLIEIKFNLEKFAIYEDKKNIELSQKKLNTLNEELNRDYLEITTLYTKELLISFIDKNQDKYVNTQALFKQNFEKLNEETQTNYIYIEDFITKLSKSIFGNTKLMISSSLLQSKNLFNEILKQLSSPLIVFNEQAISILSIIKAIIFIVIGFIIGIIYKRWLLKISKKWPNMSQMSLKLTSNVGFYFIILITLMITMSSLGIDMSSISLIAGALSIGIGFGLQTVVSNFIAGIILMFERTIRIGDIIEISDLLKGTVTDIRIRSTTIKTFDNIDIVIPNSSFIQNNVINWTLDDPTRRLHIAFGVAYGTKVEEVKRVILEELEKSELKYVKDDEEKKPEIRLDNMNSSSVDYELLVWVKANDKIRPNSLKSDFLILIYNSLYKHNIEIPFPQLDLHIKK